MVFIVAIVSYILPLAIRDFDYQDFNGFLKVFLITLLTVSIITLIPLIILYLNYYIKDSRTELLIEKNGNEFNYQNDNINIKFSKYEIEKVIRHINSRKKRKTYPWVFWDELFYYEIVLPNTSIKVSCLVIDNLKQHISKDKYEEQSHFFPRMNETVSNKMENE